jgi:hypothetical protein
MDAPPLGTARGNVVVVVIPDGSGASVTTGITDVFVVALTLMLKLLLG